MSSQTAKNPSHAPLWALLAVIASAIGSGCALIPEVDHVPQPHNPFPQLHRVAVLPFYNQSREPTVDGEAIANTYASELQKIPGFDVMPVGVAKQTLLALPEEPQSGRDFQRLARTLGVDVVLVGSVTEWSPYYPPRFGLAVNWYAANSSFHPIPPGYGLPWGTPDEEEIPKSLVREAEFALAREQLATQTPDIQEPDEPLTSERDDGVVPARAISRRRRTRTQADLRQAAPEAMEPIASDDCEAPSDWPDPSGFVPDSPRRVRPQPWPQHEPVIAHVKLYDGREAELVERLARRRRQQDDARAGGWQDDLKRPEDFIRFCCRLHATETLVARGGAGETAVAARWPLGRYDR